MANIELDTTKTQNIASKFNDKINRFLKLNVIIVIH